MNSLCYKPSTKEGILPIKKLIRYKERGSRYGFLNIKDSCSCLFPALDKLFCNRTNHLKSFSLRALQKKDISNLSGAYEGQLRLLESYFAKLQQDANQNSSEYSEKEPEAIHRSDGIDAKKELDYLDAYLGKLKKDAKIENYRPSGADSQTTETSQVATAYSVVKSANIAKKQQEKSFRELKSKDDVSSTESSQVLQQSDETFDLYVISALASINIAVFLFEIASPIRKSEYEFFSLPLLYGAKINDLILVGEWWRLVTPMFLHAGIFHVALGCWVLLTFGPQVCKGYGSFAFFLIYMLGGISGNLTSFLHTPEPTICGTGPVFAIIGAWLIYQIQNKDVTPKDVSETLYKKAVIATSLSFVISSFGPVDDWSHLGAFITGIVYGFVTCPVLQLEDSSSRTSQEERITLVRKYANPFKSLVMFAICILVLSSLLLFIEPPLDTLSSV